MKKGILVIILLSIAIFVIGHFDALHSFTVVNDLECSFSDHPEKTILSESVINGSIHFLKSKIFVDSLLYEYEKSALETFNVAVSLEHVENAIMELETAKIKYSDTIKIASRIGYNLKKAPMFKSFDYDGYGSFSHFNKEIAQEVKGYLSDFNIIGIYQKCVDDIDDILATQIIIKEQLKAGTRPSLPDIWKLMQQYSETSLFGNYASVMGRTVLGNCSE